MRQRRPTTHPEEHDQAYRERIAANPQGAALLAELDRIHERIVSQDPDGAPDNSALLRHFLTLFSHSMEPAHGCSY